MTLNIRRVITDHDQEGKAVVAIDERCANVISRRAGHQSCVAWTGADGTIYMGESNRGGHLFFYIP